MFRALKSDNQVWCAAQVLAVVVTAITCGLLPQPARADQGGIGFWLPGTFGSLAATPMQPGLSMSALYLHSFVSAGGDVAASRTIGFPNRPVNLTVALNAEINGTADVVAFGPTYVFATPVFGGQFAITALGIVGHQQANIDARSPAHWVQSGSQRSAASATRGRLSAMFSCSPRCVGVRA